jgi:hypothetical protein
MFGAWCSGVSWLMVSSCDSEGAYNACMRDQHMQGHVVAACAAHPTTNSMPGILCSADSDAAGWLLELLPSPARARLLLGPGRWPLPDDACRSSRKAPAIVPSAAAVPRHALAS